MRNIFKYLLFFILCLIPTSSFAADAEDRGLLLEVGSIWAQSGVVSTFAVDASNDAIEQVYLVGEAATVTKVCYSYGNRTGTPPTYKIGIEGVSATTGRANGTYKTGTGECSGTFTPPASTANDGTIQCVTLTGTTCSVARGEVIALTIKHSSGTVDASNNGSFNYRLSGEGVQRGQNNYLFTVNAGTATMSNGYAPIAMFYGNTSRYWGNATIGYRQDSFGGTEERGLSFQIPGPTGQTFKLLGAEVWVRDLVAGETVVVSLYTGTTSLASTTIDTDQIQGAGNNNSLLIYWNIATLPTLTFNTTYRIGVTFPTTSRYIGTMDAYNNAYLDAWPLGVNAYSTRRATGGGTAWTDDTAYRPHINPILDSIIATSGGGGIVIQNGLRGGMHN